MSILTRVDDEGDGMRKEEDTHFRLCLQTSQGVSESIVTFS